MTESVARNESMSVIVACDPANGQILRVHFTRATRDTEEGARAAAWLKKVGPAHARVMHLPPGSMEPGRSYRVDVATGALVEDSGKGGLSASSGATIIPQPTSDPLS